MKAGFGLVALLVTVAIMFYLFTLNTSEVAKVSQPAQQEAERIAGFDEDGTRAKDTITLEPMMASNKLRYLLVTDVKPQGAMARWYGLKRDDQILAVGPIEFRFENDAQLAEAMVWESRQRNSILKVRREGKEYLVQNVDGAPVWKPTGKVLDGALPDQAAPDQAAPDSAASQPPATPAPGSQTPNETPARDTTKALDRQLQQIPGISR